MQVVDDDRPNSGVDASSATGVSARRRVRAAGGKKWV